MSVSDLLDRYTAEISPRKRSCDIERYRAPTLKTHFGSVSLGRLTPAMVVAYADARLLEVSSESVTKELNLLSVAIDTAMALWGVELPANPVHTARSILKVTKTLKKHHHRERRPSPEELACLFRTLPHQMALLVEFAIETAMRRSEILAMTAQDRDGTVLRIPRTKTDEPRTIPLSSRAQAILDEVGAFTYAPSSVSHMFKRACKACGIEDLHFHDLRHEGASRLFERGWNVAEVAAVTGHSFATLQRYTHIAPALLSQKMG